MSVEISPPYTVDLGNTLGAGVRRAFLTMAHVGQKKSLATADLIWLYVQRSCALSLAPYGDMRLVWIIFLS